ncbi:hypothetical protein ACQ4PT_051205 [Festuca glaucescens]
MSACGLASVGNYIPIDKVRPDKSDAYVKKVQLKAQEMLARCKNMCDQSKVEAQILLVNGNDVVDTISNIVAQYQIQILVVGNPTSRSAFTRKSSGNRMSSKICKSVPSFCTAYVVSKDGLSSVYAPGSEIGSPSGSRVPKGSCSSSSSEIFSDGTSSISDMNNGSGQGLFGFPSLPSSNSASENLESSSSAEGLSKCLFLQLEVLSRIRHPHLLMLLGAYPDRGCLVYEYMENGSLADRLQRINGTPPIPWFHRFRIAWEIVSALVFLHSTKPSPIIHRDLKPENVLLDVNLVSKIGDVGLSTLVPLKESLSSRTVYKKTGLAGTLFYLDPEYQRTGQVSVKSDTYSFGMVVLQLLTARPPIGLPELVERAVEDGELRDILDESAGNWPLKETNDLAQLGPQLSGNAEQEPARPQERSGGRAGTAEAYRGHCVGAGAGHARLTRATQPLHVPNTQGKAC